MPSEIPPRYLFIGGLHRSGTSLVNRLANALPGAGGITGSAAPENEGVYLQGAIPHTAQSGRPMHFATNPEEHLTEAHPLNSLETKTRLAQDWAPWFAPDLQWRVEKSPLNLTRMRLMQHLFPMSQFIVVLRHPEAVAASVASWVDAPAQALIDHWIAAQAQMLDDLPYLHAVMVLRYEDIVADAPRALRRIARFTDLPEAALPEGIADGNQTYAGATQMTKAQAAEAARWGYAPGLQVSPWPGLIRHPLRAVREAVEAA
ncbi:MULTISPECIES: sulfotransferase [Sulfitobacter]|uniref:sulfotransferase family protein n=1 Tax=Sulfitobacter TaxID=60136 RepID=UPI0023079BD7|nr:MULTISPECIES: sulfotransferase [Sulfitobacter]MDF3383518.1 sulfotransferase [Sulfitobacter sp. Ks11]MDF3386936.1 sulfotransferase [Sulfitobacter sp. M85]MDF3390356.1 sulfotransferase [Sulfitobacter sp. Ks16]MDF3400993.1 sulfotransferase [Sulfitobacter sp. KE39]MDF3404414.1 sulfotransferase [Sulfitobacter sp. Ks35]